MSEMLPKSVAIGRMNRVYVSLVIIRNIIWSSKIIDAECKKKLIEEIRVKLKLTGQTLPTEKGAEDK